MSRVRSKWFVLIALLLAFAVFGAACAQQDDPGPGADVEDEGEIQEGGTVVVGAEQEPSGGLNIDLVCCTLAWGEWIRQPVFRGAYQVQPDFTYAPDLIESEAEITEDPFTITYTIKEEAQWSDGTPITADDFVFTWETVMDEKNNMASRAGYEQIEDAQVDRDKTVTFTFSEPYAGWKDLFSVVYPKHAIEGENFNKIWNKAWVDKNGEPIGSGPFLFESYNKGADLTLVKNENYWQEPAHVDEIVFRFLPETNTEIQSLRGGEVDLIYPQPQLELVPLTQQADLEVITSASTTWEHVDIQVGKNGHPALKNADVRKALAYAIDREGLVAQLFGELSPDLAPLHNTIYMQNQEQYQPNWEEYTHDVARARELLDGAGCTEGNDGIYECDGERLSFEFTSTAGNALRELAFEVIQQQVKEAGIELKSAFGDAAVVFGNKVLVAGNYDLFMFAWVGSPDPGGSVEIWKCEGSQNFTGYCNEEVTKLLESSHTLLDEAARADALNQADALMAEDVPTIPLYQKPTFLAFNTKLHGVSDNPTQEGFAWNAEDWWIEQ
ncbi:MAG TPA: peptide ABC transporter substrate-binding protein [Actinomycetota bacterium]|nr:peptide ABC transporter substrate-binding protein [Actinomycetota bacterium]